MAKFTPGPLTIHGPSPGGTPYDDGGDYAIHDNNGHIIGEAIRFCEKSYTPMPSKENALLWSAAPAMFEALIGLADKGGNERHPYCFCQHVITLGHTDQCTDAQAALELATRPDND